jgi:hypothetical protein
MDRSDLYNLTSDTLQEIWNWAEGEFSNEHTRRAIRVGAP